MEINYEKIARTLASLDGADPEMLVQVGRPDVFFGTPSGPAFPVKPDEAKALWTFYVPAARASVEAVIESGLYVAVERTVAAA